MQTKPRIKFRRSNFPSLTGWVCAGGLDADSFGRTPAAAYESWKMNHIPF